MTVLDKKFSQFADGGNLTVNDIVVGLRNGINTRFVFNGFSGIYLPLIGGTMSGNINMGNNSITNMLNPINAQDAATKSYVDSVVSGSVNPGLINQLAWYAANGSVLSGLATANNGVLVTSNLGVPSISSTLPSGLTIPGYLPTSGGTMTGQINMGGFKITNLATPTAGTDAVTKAYADSIASGLIVQPSCQAATTANLNATQAGAGVGATLTNAGVQAAFSVDGYSASLNDRILVKNQTLSQHNGIYTVTTLGDGVTNWVLTRATDYDTPAEITAGDLVAINNGTVNGGTAWLETLTVVTVDTDPISFSPFSIVTAGTGLTKTGNTISLTNPVALNLGGTNAALVANNGGIVWSNATQLQILSGTATARQMLQSGATSTPAWSTAIYPATTTANRLFYSSSNNVVDELATTASSVLTANASSVPTWVAGLNSGDVLAYNGTTWTSASIAPQANIIIGGNFSTNPWQRGVSFVSTATNTYTADRFGYYFSGTGAVSIFKTPDAPTATEAGVYTSDCLHVDTITADNTIAAGEFYGIQYQVEGYDISEAGFGQAGTRYVTLSFWHKHTKTGTYCVGFRNNLNNRAYVAEYTQAVSDTWEKAVLTIPVDTSGTWEYTSNAGLQMVFCISSGTTWQTTANTWAAGNYFATTNQVNGMDNTANNFKLALVKLELGAIATQYPAENQNDILARCQRYYEKSYNIDVYPATINAVNALVGTFSSALIGSAMGVSFGYKVPKRITVTPTIYSYSTGAVGFVSQDNGTSVACAVSVNGQNNFFITYTNTAGRSQGAFHFVANAEY